MKLHIFQKLFPFMRGDFASRTALEVVKLIKPRLIVNGHMHSDGFKSYQYSLGNKVYHILIVVKQTNIIQIM